MPTPQQVLEKLLFYDEPVNDSITYTDEPDGTPDINRLIRGEPCWPQTSAIGFVKKPKKIIITDWSVKYAIELFQSQQNLWDALLKNGAELYVWTGKLQRATNLHELHDLLLVVEPIQETDLLKRLEKDKISSDACEIIDCLKVHKLKEKLHEIVAVDPDIEIDYPLELEKFKHLDIGTLQFLLATLNFNTEVLISLEGGDVDQIKTVLAAPQVYGLKIDRKTQIYELPQIEKITKFLSIFNCEITDDEVFQLQQQYQDLETLQIGFVSKFTGSRIHEIKSEKLKEIVLWETSITTKQLLALLINNKNLHKLDLSSCKKLQENIELPTTVSAFQQLRNLNLCYTNIHPALLSQILSRSPQITKLNLSANKDLFDQFTLESDLSNLTDLNVSDTNISDVQLTNILRRCPNLQKLNLNDCINVTGSFIDDVTLPALTVLSIYNSHIKGVHLANILKKSPQLNTLKCPVYTECEEFIACLAGHFTAEQLTNLDLTRTEINDEQLLLLLHHMPNLQQLKINSCKKLSGVFANQLKHGKLTEFSFNGGRINYSQLSKLLKNCLSITRIDLNQCSNLADDKDIPISSEYQLPLNLSHLSLTRSPLSSNALADLLSSCRNLQSLRLARMEFKDFIHSIVNATLPYLQDLDLGQTNINDNWLVSTLKKCPNLVKLSIVDCHHLSDNLADRIIILCKLDKLTEISCDSKLKSTLLTENLKKHCKRLKLDNTAYVPPAPNAVAVARQEQNVDAPFHLQDRIPLAATQQPSFSNTLHFNTQTKNDSTSLHARQIFRYKDNGEPHPANYRLSVNQLALGKKIKYAEKIQDLTPVNIFFENEDPIKDYTLSGKDHPNLFYGKINLNLDKDHWVALPSLTAYDSIVGLHADGDVEVAFCETELLYYIRAKSDINKPVAVSFILEADLNRPSPALPAPQAKRIAIFPSLQFADNGHLIQNTAYHAVMNMTPNERLANLTQYCKAFSDGETLGEYDDDLQKLNAVIRQHKGSCEHRSRVFQAIAQEIGIQSRHIQNDCHEFVEITHQNVWNSIDLGGYPADLEISPIPSQALEEKGQVPTPPQQPQAGPIQPATLLPTNRFITWNTVKSNATSFDEFCADLLASAMQLPENERNILVMLDDDDQVEAFHANSLAYFQKQHTPSFYLPSLGDVAEKSAKINADGSLSKQDSELFAFIKQANNGVLITNWSDYKASYVGYNTMMDPERKLKELPIPPGIVELSVITKAQAKRMGEDFYSRFQLKSEYSVSPPTHIQQKLQHANIDAHHKAELYDSDWKSLLLGNISINGKRFHLKEGKLLKAIRANAPGLTLQNAPWHLVDFRLFITELLEKREFLVNGEKIKLPPHFHISDKKEAYQLESKEINIVSSVANQPFDFILNTENFSNFFRYRHCHELELSIKPGWIAQQIQQGKTSLALLVTENFSNAQWARLAKTARQYGCQLNLTPAPGVTLPSEFAAPQNVEPAEIFHVEHTTPVNGANLIITNDLDLAEEELYTEHPDALVISIDETTRYADLIESIAQTQHSNNTYEFNSTVSEIWQNLCDKHHGREIILKGSISPALAKQLATLFMNPPFLWINGKKEMPQQKLLLITDTPQPLSFANTIQKNYTQNDFWLHLDKKYQNLEEKNASQEMKTTQPSIPNTVYQEFKTACLTIQQETTTRFSYGQLRLMTDKIAAGMLSNPFKPFFRLHPDGKLNIAKKLWARKRRKPVLSKVEHKRHHKITDELKHSPYIFITGPSGVGKSTYVLEQLATEPDTTVFVGLDKLLHWSKPVKPGGKSILFIDEANLEKEGQWNILEGLFNKTPGLFINKKFYPLSPDHQVIFTGNFNSFAGRHNHRFFDRHGNVFNFKELPDSSLIERNISPVLSKIPGLTAHFQENIQTIFLKIYHQLNNELANHPVTARNLKMMAARFDLLCRQHPADIETMAHMAALDEVRGLLNTSQKNRFKPWLDKLTQLDQQFSPPLDNFIVTDSRKPTLRLLSHHLALRAMGHPVSQLTLEGPPGNGKSLSVIEQLKFEGFVNGLDPNVETLCPDTSKRYYHLTPTDPEKMQALLIRAFHEGAVVVIDEFNTLPLERILNQLLSGYDLEGKKAEKSGFFVIATQNPISFTGRQVLSDASENRSRKIEIAEFPLPDLQKICFGIHPNQASNDELIQEYHAAKQYAQRFNKTPAPTPRDLFHKVSLENRKRLVIEYVGLLRDILFDFGFLKSMLTLGMFGGKKNNIDGEQQQVPSHAAEMIAAIRNPHANLEMQLTNTVAIAKKVHADPELQNTFRKGKIKELYKLIAEINPKKLTNKGLASLKTQFDALKNPAMRVEAGKNSLRPKS